MTVQAAPPSGQHGLEPYVPVLGWLLAIRAVAAGGLFTVIAFLAWTGGSRYSLVVPQLVCLVELGLDLIVYRPWYARRTLLPTLAHVQLVADVVLISVALSATGGIHSPFLSLYNLVILSAGLLSLPYTMLYTVLSCAVVTGLMLGSLAGSGVEAAPQAFSAPAQLAIYGSLYVLIAIFVTYFHRNSDRHQATFDEARVTLENALSAMDVYRGQLERTNRDLAEAARVKSEFLALVSHELRTPLNSVIGFADLMLDPTVEVSEDEKKVFLGAVRDNGRQLLAIIDNILEIARLDAGRMAAGLEDVDLALLLEDLLLSTREQAAVHDMGFEARVEPGLPLVRAEPRRLQQILLILLDNAIKFSSKGGDVHLVIAREGNLSVRVEVSDRGEGIPAEHLARIFDPFYQVDPSRTRRHGGVGLGLALARTIVELQGGHIWAESRVGEGASFFLTLPVAIEPVAGRPPSGSKVSE